MLRMFKVYFMLVDIVQTKLINFIKNKFQNIAHLKPSHQEIAVVKGAVLFDINPNINTNRKAKNTIGFSTNSFWDESKKFLSKRKIPYL